MLASGWVQPGSGRADTPPYEPPARSTRTETARQRTHVEPNFCSSVAAYHKMKAPQRASGLPPRRPMGRSRRLSKPVVTLRSWHLQVRPSAAAGGVLPAVLLDRRPPRRPREKQRPSGTRRPTTTVDGRLRIPPKCEPAGVHPADPLARIACRPVAIGPFVGGPGCRPARCKAGERIVLAILKHRPFGLFFCLLLLTAGAAKFGGSAPAQERERKVRNDRESVENEGYWIYNDLPGGLAQAQKTGKPLLVVIRCIPCEACASSMPASSPATRKCAGCSTNSSACGSYTPTASTCRCFNTITTSRSPPSC